MSKSHRFDCGDGSTVMLNSVQLLALLGMPDSPPQHSSWPTYWALRNRKLIDCTPNGKRSVLTERGKAVIADYRSKHGQQT